MDSLTGPGVIPDWLRSSTAAARDRLAGGLSRDSMLKQDLSSSC